MQDIYDYLRCTKKGHGHTSHLATIDIRHNCLTRKEGKLVDEHDGKRPESSDYFLEMLSLSEDEFKEIASSQIVPHNDNDFFKL